MVDDHSSDPTREQLSALPTRNESTHPGFEALFTTGYIGTDAVDEVRTISTSGAQVATEPPELDTPADALLGGQEGGADERYRVEAVLGRGAGGQVYSVFDTHLQRSFALKVMHRRQIGNERAIGNMIREARISAELEHPNILPVYDLQTGKDGRLHLSMRKTRGVSLDHLLVEAERGEIPPVLASVGSCIDIMLKVCDAMAYAHSRGVVHQDLKPGNIMVGDYGEVLVVDWGMATQERMEGQLAGTPMYMSPEQARREGSDQRSDIYCLGTTLYHLLTLRVPVHPASQHLFWEQKRRGQLDPYQPVDEVRVPGFLRQVIATATAHDPAQRYQTCSDLADDLRQYQRNEQSISLCQEAQRQLESLAVHPDHRSYTDVQASFRQACDLWPGNQAARAGLDACIEAHARFALEAGDIALAESLIGSDEDVHGDLAKEVAQRRSHRRRLQMRARLVLVAAGLAVVAMVVIVGLVMSDHYRRIGRWVAVADLDFSVANPPLDAVYLSQHIVDEPLPITHRAGEGVVVEPGQTLWLTDLHEQGDVRVHVEATWPGLINGLDMMLHAQYATMTNHYQAPPAYVGQVGGWANLFHYIKTSRGGAEGRSVDRLALCDLESGKRYHFTFQVEQSTCTLMIDGVEIISFREPLPIVSNLHDRIALRCWAPTIIHRVEVERLSLPQQTSPVTVADTLFAFGYTADAYATYRQLAKDYPDTHIEEEALARAIMLGRNDVALRTEQRALMERFEQAYPDSVLRIDCLSALAQQAMATGDVDAAISLVPEILRIDPRARIVQRLLYSRPESMTGDQRDRLLAFFRQTSDLYWVDLNHLHLSDLETVRGLDLRMLFAEFNDISELEALRGMPLRRLFVSGNRIDDLTPLAGMKLERLDIQFNQVADLRPLWGQPLDSVNMRGNPIRTLDGLQRARIRYLDGNQMQLTDIDAIAGLPVERLYLSENQISDITALDGLPLSSVSLNNNPVDDLSPLIGTLTLNSLSISNTKVTEVPALATSRLTYFDARNTGVSDLGFLEGMPLKTVRLLGSRPVALDVLDGMGVDMLDLRFCGIEHYDATWAADDAFVMLDGNPIPPQDLAGARPGQSYSLLDMPWQAADWQALLAVWQDPDLARMARIFRSIAIGDAAALRAEATTVGDLLIVHLPVSVDLEQARSLAERMGANLPQTIDEDVLKPWFDGARLSSTWLDVVAGPGGLAWADGRALHFANQRQERMYSDAEALSVRLVGDHIRLDMVRSEQREAGVMLIWPASP